MFAVIESPPCQHLVDSVYLRVRWLLKLGFYCFTLWLLFANDAALAGPYESAMIDSYGEDSGGPFSFGKTIFFLVVIGVLVAAPRLYKIIMVVWLISSMFLIASIGLSRVGVLLMIIPSIMIAAWFEKHIS